MEAASLQLCCSLLPKPIDYTLPRAPCRSSTVEVASPLFLLGTQHCHGSGNISTAPKLEVSMEKAELQALGRETSSHRNHALENLQEAMLGEVLHGFDRQDIASLLQGQIDLADGRRIHEHLLKHGQEIDIFIGNLLVSMYSRCGALEEARFVFDSMAEPNVVSWNAMISAYAHHGYGEDALRLFQQMQWRSVKPTEITFLSMLRAYDNVAAVENGRVIHTFIVESGFEVDDALGTALVNMYSKCGVLKDARTMFDKLHQRNVVSWTTMITAYANHGYEQDAYWLFQRMQEDGVEPNKITFLGILCAIEFPAVLGMGEVIHAYIVSNGFEDDVVLATALVSMYGKCGAPEGALLMFSKMQERTVVSWNAMIDAYVQNQQGKEALKLCRQMHREGLKPDEATFVIALSACASLEALAEGEVLHDHIVESGFEADVVVMTALVNMYSKCGALNYACLIFHKMHHRNVVSWNAMIVAYMQQGHEDKALQLFYQMHQEGAIADKITYTGILSICDNLPSLTEGKRIHAWAINNGFESDVAVGTAIVNMYGKHGVLEEALAMFNRMQRRNAVSWNAMISAYSQQGHAEEALGLFIEMWHEGISLDEATFVSVLTACASLSALEEGESIHVSVIYDGIELNANVGTAIVNMYGKCGALKQACSVFDRMYQRNVATWNATIGAHAQHGYNFEAIQLFHEMHQDGVVPDRISFVHSLSACANVSALAEGEALHTCIVHHGFESDKDVGTALVNMYGKCGVLEDACLAFDKVHEHNMISWNALMTAYAQYGYGKEAVQLYLHMQQECWKPDAVTFLSLLSACSHAGLMDEGLGCYRSMREDFGITPNLEHFACLVDLYGRAGRLIDAQGFIHKMALEGCALVWMNLLGACNLHGNLELGKFAAERVMELDPENVRPYVLLSNMYATNGMWDEVDLLRKRMDLKGVHDLLAEL